MFAFCGDAATIVGGPLFVLVKQMDSVSGEFIGGLVGAALQVLLDEGFQLRIEMNRDTCKLPSKEMRCQPP